MVLIPLGEIVPNQMALPAAYFGRCLFNSDSIQVEGVNFNGQRSVVDGPPDSNRSLFCVRTLSARMTLHYHVLRAKGSIEAPANRAERQFPRGGKPINIVTAPCEPASCPYRRSKWYAM